MNQVPEERKAAVTKTFAIVGFVAIILFIVWLAVQIVSLMPAAFSSLASLADGVYNYRPVSEMVVTTQDSVVNANDPFTVRYATASEEGLYTFIYECTEGISVSLMTDTDELTPIDCGAPIELDGSGTAEFSVASEKQRFTDLAYEIQFTGVSGAEVATEKQITIINASIPTTVAVETGAETEPIEPADTTEPQPESPAPEVAGETTSPGTPEAVTPGTPEVVEEFIYAIPTSDPNGLVDLSIRMLGVGILTADNTFVPVGVIGSDQTGAFQFEVKNLGTKTSESWSYEANLPGDITYESDAQTPLKPNERAIITLGFTGVTETGVASFGANISTTDDILATNNQFISAVTITD